VQINATTDRTLIRAGAESVRYAKVSFVAPPSPRRSERWPVNVAIVLDRSGSMAGRKFELARDAAMQAIRLLQPADRFALVVYDNEIDVLAESRPVTPAGKRRAFERLARVGARGSTDLGGGWLTGAEQIRRTLESEAIGRCLLLTDGLANQGITDRGELIRAAGSLREKGVSTSTFGVGEDFDERLLRGMAQASAGNFYFIEAPEQIPYLLASELGETLEIVARDAVLGVTLGPGMSAEPLNRYGPTARRTAFASTSATWCRTRRWRW
jgi:Ca-activated chloride channel family protein